MKLIESVIQNRIAYITLNRPEKRNALNGELVAELLEVLTLAEGNDLVKVIILQANGDAFCAGADLAYLEKLQHFSYEENLADSNQLKELFYKIYTLKKVVIAQVQGAALAGGCGLASVCDFVFASAKATFGYTEVRIGFIPALVAAFLTRKVGEGRARRLLLSGNIITADEALAIGLLDKVIDADKLGDEVNVFAQHLIESNSEQALMTTKHMLSKVDTCSLEEYLSYAAEQNALARASDDCKKGIGSFLKREKIKW